MKKFFSLVLALVMALSLTTVAWGAPTAEETALQTDLNAGGTVTLSGDVVVNDGLTVPANTTVVLDLNGKTVSMAVAASTTSALITNNGTLTIKDSVGGGKLSYSTTTVSTGYSTSTINNNGVLTVVSGTIENTTTASGTGAVYGIDTYGTLTVNGGTISTSKGTAIRQAVFNYDNTVTINGGTIDGAGGGLQTHVFNGNVDITTEINGGSFSGDYAFYTYFYNVVDGSNVDIDVNGGTFDGYVYLYNGNAGSSDYPLDVSISGGTFNDWVGVYTNDASGNDVYSPAISGGTFAVAPEDDNLADGVILSETGSVVALPTKVIPSGGATLAPSFAVRGEAQYASWDAKVSLKKAENAKNEEFALYTIEMIAKVDNAPIWWASGVEEKGEDVDFTWNGEKTFVKAADEAYADFVVVDGKTITYFVAVDELEWDAKATKVTLPATPVDNADKACNTLYSGVEGVPATLYFYDDTLWVAATADDPNTTAVDESVWTDIFNVNGVAVLVREAVEDVDYEYTGHDYQLLTKGDHDTGAVTKVYCQDCKKEFKFVEAPETVAVTTFGDDNYMPVVVDGRTVPMLFMEKVTPAIPGVSGAIGGNLISYGGSSTSTSTDKVQSAATFDAGIAMYVGMSVMAAAGSAVVIGKKKD